MGMIINMDEHTDTELLIPSPGSYQTPSFYGPKICGSIPYSINEAGFLGGLLY